MANLREIVEFGRGTRDLPKKTVALTIDDGYEDNFTNAFVMLMACRILATIFIVNQSKRLNKLDLLEAKKIEDEN